MLGLGIESTCDETSLALVRDGRELIHCETFSQIESHKPFRGVVPEIASRAHLERINFLLDEVLKKTHFQWEDLEYVAVSSSPGLMGSIMMGAQLARCIGLVFGIPIIPVNHLESHIAVVRLENLDTKESNLSDNSRITTDFPYLAILLSGGNSSIYIHKGWGDVELYADTLDDALGEAFDKVAAILGLPYPGGPHIEKEAKKFIESGRLGEYGMEEDSFRGFKLPRLLKSNSADEIQFSFSGLKTAVLYASRESGDILDVGRFCYEFQEVSFELVLRNIKKAVEKTGITTVVAGGGVLANSTLRKKLDKLGNRENIKIIYPNSKFLCTDNAGMVACLGYYLRNKSAELDFPISPRSGFSI